MKVRLMCKKCDASVNVDAMPAGGLNFFLPSTLPAGWLVAEKDDDRYFNVWAHCPKHNPDAGAL
jgi:hypothetical protein